MDPKSKDALTFLATKIYKDDSQGPSRQILTIAITEGKEDYFFRMI